MGKRVMRLMGGRGVDECESEGTLVGWRDLLKKAGFFAWRSPAEVSCSAAQRVLCTQYIAEFTRGVCRRRTWSADPDSKLDI